MTTKSKLAKAKIIKTSFNKRVIKSFHSIYLLAHTAESSDIELLAIREMDSMPEY
jgi:hypothetical protein